MTTPDFDRSFEEFDRSFENFDQSLEYFPKLESTNSAFNFEDDSRAPSNIFPEDPFSAVDDEDKPRLVITETLSAMYDELCEGAISIAGRIHSQTDNFAIVDPKGCIIADRPNSYRVNPKVRPVPLLAKSRVHRKGPYLRVGLKLRANPQNQAPLTSIKVLLAVPPEMELLKISKMAQYDSLQRIVRFEPFQLAAGSNEEIQIQFETQSASAKIPKFPLFVQCMMEHLFSGITIADEQNYRITAQTKILHRKV